jgi:glycosyltransferase involved in cell wall biosynthesis
MRIGFDTSQTGPGATGCGRFADSLLDALGGVDEANEYLLYATFGESWSREARRTRSPAAPRQARLLDGLGREEAAELWSRPPADFEERIGAPDVVHANSYYCPPGLRRARLVFTVHDLVSIDEPDLLLEDNRVHCFRGLFDASVRADAVVAVSRHTRARFLERFPHYPADRVEVVHEASRFPPSRRPAAAPGPEALAPGGFWLTVGTLEPRKNLRRLLRAFARLRARGEVRPLVVAGPEGWKEEGLADAVEALGLAGAVRFEGYVEDDRLAWLYANCFAMAYVSLAEGFGLPVVEAMSLGAPVVTSSTTSLAEVAGRAAVLVDPRDEEALVEALSRLAGDGALRRRLSEAGRARAAEFSWERAARQVLAVYREAAERPPFAAPAHGATA